LFITFEGIEGSGKSTQMNLLKGYLEKKGRSVLSLREPGGTSIGESLRRILLTVGDEKITPATELFLYEACRAQLVANVIRPALRAGRIVLCDRFIDSTLAYQGHGRGIETEVIRSMNDTASGGIKPDITFFLDIEAKAGLQRAWTRLNNGDGAGEDGVKEDRFEREDMAFHERVRRGFLEIAAREQRVRIIDGRGEIHSIHAAICAIINKMNL